MTKFSKRVNYTLLGFLTLLNVLLRYPTSAHEHSTRDSFFIHGLANSISQNGYAKWVINPLSIFGLYPYSYPSAVPYILSGVSQCMGLNMEWTIFLVAIFIGIFGMFGAYLMAREVKDDDLFVFLVVFAFSTAPIFLSLTLWTASTRNLFIALIPLFIWALLNYHHKKDKRYLLLSVILLIIFATVHRMVWLIIPIVFAYFVAVMIQEAKRKIKISKDVLISIFALLLLTLLIVCIVIFTGNILLLVLLIFVAYFLNIFLRKMDEKIKVPMITSFILVLLFVSAFLIQFSEAEFYRGMWLDYQTGFLFEGSELHILILNMLSNYTGHTGILIIFGVIGFPLLLFKSKKGFNELFVLLSILFLIPLLALGTYTSILLLPFFSILVGMSLRKIITVGRVKKYAFPAIVGCLLISLCFSGFMINHWSNLTYRNTDTTSMVRDETYSAAVFLKDYGHGAFISSDNIIGYRISAYSENPLFPGHSAWPLAYGFIENVEIVSLTEFTLNLDYLYVVNNTVKNDYTALLTLDCDNTTAKEILSKYRIHYYIENNNMQSQNQFFKSVREKRYKIYDNGVESIWYLGRGY